MTLSITTFIHPIYSHTFPYITPLKSSQIYNRRIHVFKLMENPSIQHFLAHPPYSILPTTNYPTTVIQLYCITYHPYCYMYHPYLYSHPNSLLFFFVRSSPPSSFSSSVHPSFHLIDMYASIGIRRR